MYLSLIVPCYNESKNSNFLIEKISKKIKDCDMELLIVNNGSTDDSSYVIDKILEKNKFVSVVNIEKNIGYGHGIMTGISKAKGKFIAYTHADLQTDPNDIFKVYDNLKEENKNIFYKGKRVKQKLYNNIFSIGMSLVTSLYLNKKMYEINAQPTVFHKNFITNIEDPPIDFSFDLYLYYIALKNNYIIKRFPVFFHKRIYGEAHLKNLNTKIKYSFTIIKYVNKLRKKIKNNL